MSSQQRNQRIRLKKKVNDIQIEIWIDSENEFREGYALLNRLCLRAEIEELRLDIERVWIRDTEGKRIDETITESIHRVALSLLEDWPKSKSVSDTQKETRLSQGSVSNILAGRQGGAGDWFAKQGELWNLSTKGVTEVRNLISSILNIEEI
jgi:hypothetical protein